MFFIKFEELKSDPQPILKKLFKFLLDIEDIQGTVLERRISNAAPEPVYVIKTKTNHQFTDG